MIALITAALAIGVLGNLHCIGMCGPIALALPVHNDVALVKSLKIVVYNVGRILTYGLLGLAFGMLGRSFVIAGYQQWLSIISGLLILLLFFVPGLSHKFQNIRLIGALKNSMRDFLQRKNTTALFVFGMLNGLLPCGLVYIAIAASVATMDPLKGSVFMMMFGFATLPVMFAMSYSAALIKNKSGLVFKKASAVLILLVATVLILRGMNLGIPYVSPAISTPFEEVNCCKHP